ncbi:MAG: DUF433 domain-containing protein [Nitrospirae bacterium]|nr:DUF433 domain-containing protein [Nitrospirota bacterium]
MLKNVKSSILFQSELHEKKCGAADRAASRQRNHGEGSKRDMGGVPFPLIILEQLAEGESLDKILAGYPELTRKDIH